MSKWFNSLAIRWKLALVTAATTAVALLIAGNVTIVLEARSYQRQKVEELTAQAKILSVNVIAAAVFGDSEAATSALSGLATNPQITLGAVYDAEGGVLARYARSDAMLDLIPGGPPWAPNADVTDGAVTISTLVLQDNATVGTVFVRAQIESVAARSARQAAVLLAVGLASLAFAVPVSMRMHRTVTNPIEELAAKNAIIETTLASVDHGILVTDKNHRVTFLNERHNEMFGPNVGITIGTDMMAMLQQRRAQRPESAAVIDQEMARHAMTEPFRDELNLPDGHTIEYRQTPLPGGGFVRTYTDITQERVIQQSLKDAKARAEEADRAKSAFLAAMSHEIRTPMNGVIGIIELLHATPLTREQRQMVDIVRQSGTGLLDVINDILDYSKIEAGRMTVEATAFSLGDLIETTVKTVSGHTKSKTLNIVCAVDPRIDWSVKGDPVRVRQILLNLLGNALKFTEMGTIDLEVIPEGVEDNKLTVMFEVRDTGIGIPADKTDRLFQRFSQADYSTTRRFGGTGLGLSISKHLVELMGGEIGVRSREGEGSTFWFRIPFARLPAEERVAPFADVAASLAGVHVVVCDRLSRHSTVAAYLRAVGVEVSEAPAISQVVDRYYQEEARHHAPEVIILNVRLGEDSISLLSAELAKRKGLRSAKVLLILPHMSASAAKPLLTTNVSAVIFSPVSHRELYETVATLAGRAANLKRQAPQQLEFVAPSVEEAAGRGCLILVAEDNETNQFVIRTQLQRLGYAAELSADGQEAWNLMRDNPGRYGLLLTDCHMPFLDGYQLSRMLRDQERGSERHLPIVALTANALEGEADLCRAAGMDDYLSKPVQLATLDATIRKWIPRAAELRTPVDGAARATEPGDAQAPTSTTVKTPPIDILKFGEMIGSNDEEFLKGMLVEFRESMLETHQQVCDSITARDARALKHAAHAAKGSAASACAAALADAYKQLEAAAGTDDWTTIDALSDPLALAFADVSEYLKENVPASGLSARASYG